MIAILIKFVLPLVGVYFALKFLRQQIVGMEGTKSDRLGQTDPIIEICPECGQEKNRGHRC